jgi:hypothetical protein
VNKDEEDETDLTFIYPPFSLPFDIHPLFSMVSSIHLLSSLSLPLRFLSSSVCVGVRARARLVLVVGLEVVFRFCSSLSSSFS